MHLSVEEWSEYYHMYVEGVQRGQRDTEEDRDWEDRQCHKNGNNLASSAAMLGFQHGRADEGPYDPQYLAENYF